MFYLVKLFGESVYIVVVIVKDGIKWSDDFLKIKFVFLLFLFKIENIDLKYIIKVIVLLIEEDEM